MVMKLTVTGKVENAPDAFPETGSLVAYPICPPVRVGNYWAMPRPQFVGWGSELNKEQVEALATAAGLGQHTPYLPPTAAQIPSEIAALRISEEHLIWPHDARGERHELYKLEETGIVLLVYFVANKPIIRLGILGEEIELDCSWAEEALGMAAIAWDGRIEKMTLMYLATTSAPMKMATKTNLPDNALTSSSPTKGTIYDHPFQQVAVGIEPGSTFPSSPDELLAAQPSPLVLLVALASDRAHSQDELNDISRRVLSAVDVSKLASLVPSPLGIGDTVGVPLLLAPYLTENDIFENVKSRLRQPSDVTSQIRFFVGSAAATKAELEEVLALLLVRDLNRTLRNYDDHRLSWVPRGFLLANWEALEGALELHRDHYVETSEAIEFLAETERRFFGTRPRILLRAEFDGLFDIIGRNWLKSQNPKRLAALKYGRKGRHPIAIPDDLSSPENGFVRAYSLFREDISIEQSDATSHLADAWAETTFLKSAVQKAWPHLDASQAIRFRKRLQADAHWQAAVFELAVVALLSDVAVVKLVDTSSGRSPDIDVGGGAAFVECCRKEPRSAPAEKLYRMIQRAMAFAIHVSERSRESRLTEIRFKDGVQPSDEQLVRESIKAGIAGGSSTSPVCDVQSRGLGDWRLVWAPSALRDLAPADTRDAMIFGVGISATALFNTNVVASAYSMERDVVASVEHTLKDKGRWISRGGQLPDGRPCALAIDLGEIPEAEAERATAVLGQLLQRSFRAVAVLLLFGTYVRRDGYFALGRVHWARPILNPAASTPWPDALRLPRGAYAGSGVLPQSL